MLTKKGCFGDSIVADLKFCEDNVIRKTQRVKSAQAKHATKDKLDYIL